MTRQDRQRAEIVALSRGGEHSRAIALASEHLAEFPDDAGVADIARSLDWQAALGQELENLH